jgi:hypothetical protein
LDRYIFPSHVLRRVVIRKAGIGYVVDSSSCTTYVLRGCLTPTGLSAGSGAVTRGQAVGLNTDWQTIFHFAWEIEPKRTNSLLALTPVATTGFSRTMLFCHAQNKSASTPASTPHFGSSQAPELRCLDIRLASTSLSTKGARSLAALRGVPASLGAGTLYNMNSRLGDEPHTFVVGESSRECSILSINQLCFHLYTANRPSYINTPASSNHNSTRSISFARWPILEAHQA